MELRSFLFQIVAPLSVLISHENQDVLHRGLQCLKIFFVFQAAKATLVKVVF